MIKLPRTFCISLKETPKRKEYVKQCFSDINKEIEFFDGVYGKNIGLKTTSPNLLEFNNNNMFMTSGAIGCALSHFILWNICNYLPEEEFFIIEDDVVLCEEFLNKFDVCYNELPLDWEFVNVGWVPYGNEDHCKKISDNISSGKVSATHGYLIKKSVIPKLINSFHPMCNPIDLTLMDRVFPNINHYVFDPSLIYQKTYLNCNDPLWMSSIYDWTNDPYKVMYRIAKNISLGDGWYMTENSGEKNVWKWSFPKFNFKMSGNFPFDKIGLIFSSVYENTLTFTDDLKNIQQYDVKSGDNEIIVSLNKSSIFTGEVSTKFIPKNTVPNSKDERELGICLKGMYLYINNEKLTINIL